MKYWKSIISIYRAIHLRPRFFFSLGGLASLFALSFPFNVLFPLAQAGCIFLFVLTITEGAVLFSRQVLATVARKTPKLLSLGDDNTIQLRVLNTSSTRLSFEIYDELPVQLQRRDFRVTTTLRSNEQKIIRYTVNPKSRGEFSFGYTNVISHSVIGLVSRHERIKHRQVIPAFPSILQMKKYELIAFAKISNFEGIKKIRRLGHSYEFEQIKAYVQGDDIRSINWKATGRRNQLMVNQYEDERSQQVYTIIDKSRAMHMPFNGLSLLDYAINTSLVISNIALRKHDRAGLISFSDRIGSTIKAERTPVQLKKILQALYNEKSHVKEANYDLLYQSVKNVVKSRSLLFLYTNFESAYAMERALPVLQRINHQHLLVLMIFENTELVEYSRKGAEYLTDIYTQTMAEKLILEKKHMVLKLRKHGIQTILSKPEDLSINTVNKYLELKAKGLI